MAERNYSHVCAACRSPTLINLKGRTGLNVLILSLTTVGGGFLSSIFFRYLMTSRDSSIALALGEWGMLLLVLSPVGMGLGGGYLYLRQALQKKALNCPSCHANNLLPVTSPEGLRVMKELGFTES